MGLVTQREGQAAADIASRVSGVKTRNYGIYPAEITKKPGKFAGLFLLCQNSEQRNSASDRPAQRHQPAGQPQRF